MGCSGPVIRPEGMWAIYIVAEGGRKVRFSGSVTFSILTPNKDRSKIVERAEHTMSQDDFVRFLIAGPVEGLKTEIERLRQRTLNDG